jgi:hypothetical protein
MSKDNSNVFSRNYGTIVKVSVVMVILAIAVIRLRVAVGEDIRDPLANVRPVPFSKQRVNIPAHLLPNVPGLSLQSLPLERDGKIRDSTGVVIGSFVATPTDVNADSINEAFVTFTIQSSSGFFVEQFFPSDSFVPMGELDSATFSGGLIRVGQSCWQVGSDSLTGRIFGRTLVSC